MLLKSYNLFHVLKCRVQHRVYSKYYKSIQRTHWETPKGSSKELSSRLWNCLVNNAALRNFKSLTSVFSSTFYKICLYYCTVFLVLIWNVGVWLLHRHKETFGHTPTFEIKKIILKSGNLTTLTLHGHSVLTGVSVLWQSPNRGGLYYCKQMDLDNLVEVSEWLSVWLSLAVFDVACALAVWRSVLADSAVAMDYIYIYRSMVVA